MTYSLPLLHLFQRARRVEGPASSVLWADALNQEVGRHRRGYLEWALATVAVGRQVVLVAQLRLHLHDVEWAVL